MLLVSRKKFDWVNLITLVFVIILVMVFVYSSRANRWGGTPNVSAPKEINQVADGSGFVSFSAKITDNDFSETKLQIEYSDDGGENFYQAHLASVTPSEGDVNLDNNDTFQIGSKDPIDTDTGTVNLIIVWDSKSAKNGGGSLDKKLNENIQLRLTPSDCIEIIAQAEEPVEAVDSEEKFFEEESIESVEEEEIQEEKVLEGVELDSEEDEEFVVEDDISEVIEEVIEEEIVEEDVPVETTSEEEVQEIKTNNGKKDKAFLDYQLFEIVKVALAQTEQQDEFETIEDVCQSGSAVVSDSFTVDNSVPRLTGWQIDDINGLIYIDFSKEMDHDSLLDISKIVFKDLSSEYEDYALIKADYSWLGDANLEIQLSVIDKSFIMFDEVFDYIPNNADLNINEESGLKDLFGNEVLFLTNQTITEEDAFEEEVTEEVIEDVEEKKEADSFIVFDKDAKHKCKIKPFSQKLVAGQSFKLVVDIMPSDNNLAFNLIVGNLPEGMSFNLEKLSGMGAQSLEGVISTDISLNSGSYNIILVYQEEVEPGIYKNNFCKFNQKIE